MSHQLQKTLKFLCRLLLLQNCDASIELAIPRIFSSFEHIQTCISNNFWIHGNYIIFWKLQTTMVMKPLLIHIIPTFIITTIQTHILHFFPIHTFPFKTCACFPIYVQNHLTPIHIISIRGIFKTFHHNHFINIDFSNNSLFKSLFHIPYLFLQM